MTDECSRTSGSSGADRPIDFATVTGGQEETGCTSSDSSSSNTNSGATAAVGGEVYGRRIGRRLLAWNSSMRRWRKHYSNSNRVGRKQANKYIDISSGLSPTPDTTSQSNNQPAFASTESLDNPVEASASQSEVSANASPDSNPEEGSSFAEQSDKMIVPDQHETQGPFDEGTSDNHVFLNLDDGAQSQSSEQAKSEASEQPGLVDKSELANVIEKAILDFCSSRTVETMRRMFAGATSEMEALQGESGRQGDKSAQAPHPVTGELVKEGIVIGQMDVFSPRVHREYRLEMRDNLVEGFLKDTGVFRAICYRTKCQLEVTRRLLNKKLCTGGRWVKYLIVRIVGPSVRAISCCDQLLQKAVPAFKHRIEYTKAAFCRLFFREDIPDNAALYHGYQRTGGTSIRYGALRLETPYRVTTERTIGSCPWKSGALKVGKLALSGSGSHLCMRQVYPGYGYTNTTPVEPECQGIEAVHRIERMHSQFVTRRQLLLQDRRVMTIPVCR